MVVDGGGWVVYQEMILLIRTLRSKALVGTVGTVEVTSRAGRGAETG